MDVRAQLPADVAESRTDRRRVALNRKRLARGKTMFLIACPEGDWKSLSDSMQQQWASAYREAQADFDRQAGVLAGAAKLARSLRMYDTSSGRDYVLFEHAFIGLPTVDQMWLMKVYEECKFSFRRNSVKKMSTTIEFTGNLGSKLAEKVFVQCSDAAKTVNEANPGLHLEYSVTQARKSQ